MLILLLQLQVIKISVNKETFKMMKDKTIVCNIGHFDNQGWT